MEPEMVTQLLERIDDKQRISVLRHLSHNNKKLRIPGFSLMEKAPIKIVANTSRTNKHFRSALFESISAVILDGVKVDCSKCLDTLKSEIPQKKWLGLAAHLLMLSEEEHTDDATKLISDYDATKQSASDIAEVLDALPEPKTDKKEERFREKYLKEKGENAKLTAELEKVNRSLHDAGNTIDTMKLNQLELEGKCAAYLAEIARLSDENAKLICQLGEATKAELHVPAHLGSSVDIHVLAPNCKDILEKYRDTIPMDFSGNLDQNSPDVMEKYDEIWVFPNLISFGTYRLLKKWKRSADDKVFIFETTGELISHAEKMLQTARRR
jgi:hypothetical protein